MSRRGTSITIVPLARLDEPLTAVVMVRDDDPIETLADLEGKTIGLPPALSAVSELVKAALIEAGLLPGVDVALQHYRTKMSCLQAVAVGRADACGVPRFALSQIDPNNERKLRLLVETEPISHFVFAAHARVPEADRVDLCRSILAWPCTAKGREILAGGAWTRLRRRQGSGLRRDPTLCCGCSASRRDSRPMSLKYRIAVTIFALEIVLIAVVLWITLGHSMDHVREQIARTEEVTMQLLGDLSRAALLTDEYADLQTFIEGTSGTRGFSAVIIGDAAGRVVAATDVALIGSPLPATQDRRASLLAPASTIRGPRQRARRSLAIEFSDFPLVLAYRETRNLGIKIAITGMVAIAVVGLGDGLRPDPPAGRAWPTAADRVAGGDLTVRVEVSGRDEVARVGRAFNSMVERLADNLDALRAARDRLVQPTEAMSEGFALWDADDRLVLYNSKLRRHVRRLVATGSCSASFDEASAAPCSRAPAGARGSTCRRSRPGSRTALRSIAGTARAVGDASA